MKKNIITLFLLFGISNSYCQRHLEKNDDFIDYQISYTIALEEATRSVISYLDWSNPIAFEQSPKPMVSGYGYYSDSLSKVYNGKTFYANGDEYFLIESWADYYFWYTKRFWYYFKNPELYELYYLSQNDYEMVKYIVSHNYLGNLYPSLIKIDFKDSKYTLNRLADEEYFINERKKIKEFERELDKNKPNPYVKHNRNKNPQQDHSVEFRNMDQNKLDQIQNKEQQKNNIEQVKKEKLE